MYNTPHLNLHDVAYKRDSSGTYAAMLNAGIYTKSDGGACIPCECMLHICSY